MILLYTLLIAALGAKAPITEATLVQQANQKIARSRIDTSTIVINNDIDFKSNLQQYGWTKAHSLYFAKVNNDVNPHAEGGMHYTVDDNGVIFHDGVMVHMAYESMEKLEHSYNAFVGEQFTDHPGLYDNIGDEVHADHHANIIADATAHHAKIAQIVNITLSGNGVDTSVNVKARNTVTGPAALAYLQQMRDEAAAAQGNQEAAARLEMLRKQLLAEQANEERLQNARKARERQMQEANEMDQFGVVPNVPARVETRSIISGTTSSDNTLGGVALNRVPGRVIARGLASDVASSVAASGVDLSMRPAGISNSFGDRFRLTVSSRFNSNTQQPALTLVPNNRRTQRAPGLALGSGNFAQQQSSAAFAPQPSKTLAADDI